MYRIKVTSNELNKDRNNEVEKEWIKKEEEWIKKEKERMNQKREKQKWIREREKERIN